MKKFYRKCRPFLTAAGRLLPALLIGCWLTAAEGQTLSVTLSATNNSLNNCNARKLTASVNGGSGNYAYFWSSSPASSVYLGNGPSITVSPSVGTTYTVAVEDLVSGQYVQRSLLVSPLLQGSLQLFIPNAFFEGNQWKVMDEEKSTDPLNAFEYRLTIIDDWGNQVFSASGLVSNGVMGLRGGEISWNGRLYGSGSYVPAGNYFYDLRLINCSVNELIRGTITFFRQSGLVLEAYPNPSTSEVNLRFASSAGSEADKELVTDLPAPVLVRLLAPQGEVVLSERITAFPARLPLAGVPEGTYSLSVQCGALQLNKRLKVQH
ncbi:hypothetical protein [Nafulsella turpanensis]|uniref:hypothetical protein n=1 Tax=Nafulsella turpanensis TaxID=1265690 RepID=UPI00037E2809|nr:hypothetical protein [Nafulsella turpanensis]